jgi:predicted RecB family endonuclease
MYAAQACWSWPGRDRSTVDWLKHSDEYLAQILSLSSHLERYLTLPNSSRARHKMLKVWQREAQETLAVAAHLYEEIIDRLSTMAEMTEITKREGLPGNEAARIRQWEIMVLEETEKLRMIKVYRTRTCP